MIRTLLVSAAAALSIATSASATTHVLDFSSTPVGSVSNFMDVSTQYQSQGVTFSLFENGGHVGGASLQNTWAVKNGGGYNLGNFVSGSGFSNSNRADVLSMNFTNAVSGVSFLHQGWGGATQFRAFDVGGNLLESRQGTTGLSAISFASSGIFRIDALQAYDAYGYGIDDLTYTVASAARVGGPAPVPVPAALPMLVAGLGGLGVVARRRKG